MRLPCSVLLVLFFQLASLAQTLTTVSQFNYTGATQTFVIPPCVHQMTVTVKGAQGGAAGLASGGEGGQVGAVIQVTPGTVVYINVGGQGSLTAGGFNGGASGGNGPSGNGAGGGGASDIRIGSNSLPNRIIVAGGGGGGAAGPNVVSSGGRAGLGGFCFSPLGQGGHGGTGLSIGGNGSCAPGTATAFGSGGAGAGLTGGGSVSGNGNGTNGAAGSLGLGGAGGSGGIYGAGGGGGGYYGGAGGMSANTNTAGPNGSGGGGGGSSFVDGSFLIGNPFFNSYNYGHGVVWFVYMLTGTLQVNATSTTVCSGGTVGLSTSGLSTYTWHPVGNFTGSNTASAIASPTANTVYSVSGHNASGCLFRSQVSVQVENAVPSLSVYPMPSFSVCLGSTVALLAVGSNSITWSPPYTNGTTFTPAVNQTFTVQALNSCGVSTTLVPVSLAQIPMTVYTSPTLHCQGSIIGLHAVGALNSFTWMPGSLSGSSTAVIANSPVIYTVTASGSFSCLSQTTLQLSPAPVPTITVFSSTPGVCPGQTLNLTATGAQSYTWLPGNFQGNIQTPTVNSNQSFTVLGSNGTPCFGQTIVSVFVNPSPIINLQSLPAQVCSGQTLTIFASGAQTYTWFPNAYNGAAYTTTLNSGQNFTVIGSNGFSCSSQNTLSVTVNPLPTLQVQATSSLVCAGSTVGISASSNGTVNWSNGFAGYQQTISPPTSTVYTLISQLGNCTSSAAIGVDVFQPSLSVSASGTICAGQFFTLQAYSYTNSTYQWAPLSSQQASLLANPLTTTLYTVTALSHSNNLVCPLTETIQVIVHPLPVLTISATASSICQDEGPVVITGGGANTYTWNTSAQSVNISVSPSITTVYSYTGTSVNGCHQSISLMVTVHPLPVLTISATASSICQDDGPVVITGGGANTYTWNTSAQSVTISVSPSITTVYSYTGTSVHGCSQNTSFTLQVHECLNTEETDFQKWAVEVYPNPSHANDVTIKTTQTSVRFVVLNSLGQIVIIAELNKNNAYEYKLEFLPPGIYTIHAFRENLKVTKKIIVE